MDREKRKTLAKLMEENKVYISATMAQGETMEGILYDIAITTDAYWIETKEDIFRLEYTFNPFLITKIEPKSENVLSETSAKNDNLKKEMDKMEHVKVLKNGVKVYNLYDYATADYDEANDILDCGETTERIDAYDAYRDRVKNNFVGVYKVKVERKNDYERFIGMMHEEKDHLKSEYEKKVEELREQYYDDKIPSGEYWNMSDKLYEEYREAKKNCKCSICSFRIPTYEEWKSGKYQVDEKRQMKLGKAMRKAGYSQQFLDFYSQQIKTEKELYFTISDLPQHIAGMSYYAKMHSWDGYGGTSCQDPRHDYEECICLAGSLHDNKLFVGMLHNSLDDLKDMTDKLLARTLFRLLHIDNEQVLVATTYYGNNTTKNELHLAIEQLEEINVFTKEILDDGQYIKEVANGYYQMEITSEVYVCETIDDYVHIECPMCNGDGEYEILSYEFDREFNIACPACGGTGEYETSVYIDIDEYVEVADIEEIRPYAEGYSHYGDFIEIRVNTEKIKEVLRKNKEQVTV